MARRALGRLDGGRRGVAQAHEARGLRAAERRPVVEAHERGDRGSGEQHDGDQSERDEGGVAQVPAHVLRGREERSPTGPESSPELCGTGMRGLPLPPSKTELLRSESSAQAHVSGSGRKFDERRSPPAPPCRDPRARLRVRRPASCLRAGRMGGSRAARRGVPPAAGRARARAGHAARRTERSSAGATLDALIAELAGRPPAQARAGRAGGAAARHLPAAVPRARARARRGGRERRARQERRRPAAQSSSTPCCAGLRARAAHGSPALPDDTPERPRCATRTPSGSRSCGGTRSAPTRRARCSPPATSPPRTRSAPNTLQDQPGGAPAAPARRRPGTSATRSSSTAPGTPTRRRSSRRACACRSRARRRRSPGCSTRSPASGSSTCARPPAARRPTSPH